MNVTAGQTYVIVVDGYADKRGQFSLTRDTAVLSLHRAGDDAVSCDHGLRGVDDGSRAPGRMRQPSSRCAFAELTSRAVRRR